VFVPGVQQGPHVRIPRRAATFAFALTTIVAVVASWAAFAARPASDDHAGIAPTAAVGALGSVALLVPGGPVDHLFVQRATPNSARTFITDFPSTFTLHARGATSPVGDRVAVLWVDGQPGAARLTTVDLRTGDRVEAQGAFAYLSTLPWSRDGARVAALAAARPDASGRFTATIVQVDVTSGAVQPVADFEAVLSAAPVGYSMDNSRVFVVIIDQSGSALWSTGAGKTQRLAQMSAGRTQDWSLSPDGTRLAFTEAYGVGPTRAISGRVLTIASGNITVSALIGEQLGTAWRPDSETPAFGGPGGDVQLSSGEAGEYLVPAAWSPDGKALVAQVYSSVDASARSLQFITYDGRFELATEPGSSFLGFVTNLD